MKLHIFNPEHDIALAAGTGFFTAPRAGRTMRMDLGFLPALWAKDGDFVLVDDVSVANERSSQLSKYVSAVTFISYDDLKKLDLSVLEVDVWGWDWAICKRLLRSNPAIAPLLPSNESLNCIRTLSSRQYAAEKLLPALLSIDSRLIGSAEFVTSEEVLFNRLSDGHWVLKSPWSSSGRGVRYVEGKSFSKDDDMSSGLCGWCRNVIKQQGGIMLEPYYNKVKDFALEFYSDGHGNITYLGLSIFATKNGTYIGNIIASETYKKEILAPYVSITLLDAVHEKIIELLKESIGANYKGSFGVDMMIVCEDGEYRLHPCVELNLRRTMGHVSLSLANNPHIQHPSIMNISHDRGVHRFNISRYQANDEF